MVSIHTRHYWRVKHLDEMAEQRGAVCFNPHPPLLAGETRAVSGNGADAQGFNPHPPLLAGETKGNIMKAFDNIVSIHTRHYWRVKPLTYKPLPLHGFPQHLRELGCEIRHLQRNFYQKTKKTKQKQGVVSCANLPMN